MASPYSNRPKRTFWKAAVSSYPAGEVGELYTPRFEITPQMRVATAGSCFAQHIAKNMRARGYNVLDLEPPPPGISEELGKQFGYNLFSARYGNIYTIRQFLQLVQEALGQFRQSDIVWKKGDRYYDALRPSVEPDGLGSPEEVAVHRRHHRLRVKEMLTRVDVMVFTFGLTEAWVHTESGTVYPTAPETIAGTYDPDVYSFKNFTIDEIVQDFAAVRALMRSLRPELKFLITVSPVPLNATATDNHVLVATMQSKSVLRAAAARLYEMFDDVDYFPSYEIIATPFFGKVFFDENRRDVSAEGVETVMETFFAAHATGGSKRRRNADAPASGRKKRPVTIKQVRRQVRREQIGELSEAEKEKRRERVAAKKANVKARAERVTSEKITAPAPEPKTPAQTAAAKPSGRKKKSDDVVCEDALLAAFSPKS